MKTRTPDKFWFPWWPDKWIFGSVRIECTPAERGIWVDLLSLASKDNGHIRANEETPYPLQQLAGMLIIPEDQLDNAIKKFIKTEKLTKKKSGTLYITKWEKYQFSDRHKRRVKKDMSAKTAIMSEDQDAILYNNKLDNNKVEEKKEETTSLAPLQQQIYDELKKFGKLSGDFTETVLYITDDLAAEFSSVNPLDEVKAKIAHWHDKPLKKNSNVHLQLRNWFRKAVEFQERDRKERQVGKSPSKEEMDKAYEARKIKALAKVKNEVVICYKCKSQVDAAEFCPSCGEEMLWRFL